MVTLTAVSSAGSGRRDLSLRSLVTTSFHPLRPLEALPELSSTNSSLDIDSFGSGAEFRLRPDFDTCPVATQVQQCGFLPLTMKKVYPASASECVRDIEDAFAGHCHLENKFLSGNARFAYNRRDIPD